MVFNHLARHWLARRHYPVASWLACIARSSRVLLFYRDHRRLLRLDVYRNYLTQVHDDVFHHLSHRNYLVKGLSLRERVRCVHTHYRFECATFDAAYQQAVYRDGGLPLWRHEADEGLFTIRLEMAERLNAEGDLTLTACAGAKRLHRLSFSWVDGAFVGRAAPVLPLIVRNQGHRADDAAAAFDAFERAFPQNSPSYFCFAALQGLAQALGMDEVVAVKAAWQCAYDARDAQRFTNAYDGFWQTLGAVPMEGRGWRIPLPLPLKPLSEMSSRHRKRAMQRREHWRAIAEAARAAIQPHVLPQPRTARPLRLATNA